MTRACFYALFMGLISSIGWANVENNQHIANLSAGRSTEQTYSLKRAAIKIDPVTIAYQGTVSLEYEAFLNENISLYTPIFFADKSMAAFKDALFWKTSLGFGVGAKFRLMNQNKNMTIYLAPEIMMMVAWGFPVPERRSIYEQSPVYRVYEQLKTDLRSAGPFWIPTTSIWLGAQYIDKSGFIFDAGVAARMYNFLTVWPELKVMLGFAF